MKKFITSLVGISVAVSLGGGAAFAQRDFSNVEIKTTKVADGIYMLVGAGGNIGLSIGDDGSFVIDDQFAPLSEKIMAAIKAQTDAPVEFVLNTHFHGDHTGGNEAFGKAGSHIVAHDNVRKRLIEGRERADGSRTPPAPADALPVVTFSQTISFYWNGQDIHVWHPDTAHTDGDSIVFFKTANVVHMGDVFFNGGYPFIDLNSGGGVSGYIAAHENVLSEIDDETKIIPGHGPLATKADLAKTVAMLKDAKALVMAQIEKGLDEDAVVAANPLKKYNKKWGQGFINGERMTRTLYRDLTSAE